MGQTILVTRRDGRWSFGTGWIRSRDGPKQQMNACKCNLFPGPLTEVTFGAAVGCERITAHSKLSAIGLLAPEHSDRARCALVGSCPPTYYLGDSSCPLTLEHRNVPNALKV